MKYGKSLLVATAFLALLFSVPVSNVVAFTSPGVPAGLVMSGSDGLTVIGINISSDIAREDINDLYGLATGLLSKLGGDNAVSALSPDQLEGMHLTGDSLHNLIVSNLSSFNRYLQVNVFTISTPVEGYRIEVYLWDNDQNTAGTFMAAVEIPKSLPLLQLLGIMETGIHNLKIDTTADETSKVSRMSFYYQDSSASSEVYVASVEITGLLIQMVMSALM